jgi:riboflavin synthase
VVTGFLYHVELMAWRLPGKLQVGSGVNCERAMAGHTRFGGHMVQGHVDSTATIVSKKVDGNSIRYSFRFPADVVNTFMPYLIEKGYVTVDGASLTLTHVSPLSAPAEESVFGIMLIAHSQEKLTLTKKEVGDTVNIEVDCVGKYVLRSVEGEGTGGLRGLVERLVDAKVDEKLKALGLNK